MWGFLYGKRQGRGDPGGRPNAMRGSPTAICRGLACSAQSLAAPERSRARFTRPCTHCTGSVSHTLLPAPYCLLPAGAARKKRSDPSIQPLDESLLSYLEVKFHGLTSLSANSRGKSSISKHPFLLRMENRGKVGITVRQPQPLPGKGLYGASVELLFS